MCFPSGLTMKKKEFDPKRMALPVNYRPHALERMARGQITKRMVEETIWDTSCFIERDGDRIKHECYPTAVVFVEKDHSFVVITAFRIEAKKHVR